MITKESDVLYDKTCQVIQEVAQYEFFPKVIGFLRLPYQKYTVFKGLGPSLS